MIQLSYIYFEKLFATIYLYYLLSTYIERKSLKIGLNWNKIIEEKIENF